MQQSPFLTFLKMDRFRFYVIFMVVHLWKNHNQNAGFEQLIDFRLLWIDQILITLC